MPNIKNGKHKKNLWHSAYCQPLLFGLMSLYVSLDRKKFIIISSLRIMQESLAYPGQTFALLENIKGLSASIYDIRFEVNPAS
jgi:hypothetical protein